MSIQFSKTNPFALWLVMLSLLISQVPVIAQSDAITGTVTDKDKQALVGAMVIVQGTQKGTMTDYYGKFILTGVSPDAVLEISYLGFDTEVVHAAGLREVNVVMKESVSELDQAVAIGYGSVKRRDLTGAVVSMSTDDIVEKSPVNVFEAMQGSIAGVQIVTNSGAPGEGATMRVRGTGTFEGGADPLFVVDEILVDDISDLNPKDIASIEVLKDASSAAIYGSRSANGVILITTKTGQRGKPKFDISVNNSYGQISHLMPLTTPDQYRYYNRVRRELMGTDEGAWRTVTDSLRNFVNGSGNQYEYLLQTAKKIDVTASLAGASDKMKYFLSAAFLNEDGVIVNSNYKRLTTRMNASYNVSQRLVISNNFSFSFIDNKGVDAEQMVNSLYTWLPYWNVTDVSGNVMPAVGGKYSSYLRAEQEKNQTKQFSVNALVAAQYKITDWLSFKVSFAGNVRMSKKYFFRPTTLLSSTGHTSGYDLTGLNYSWRNEDYLQLNKKFSGHKITAMLGFGVYDYHVENAQVYGMDFNNDFIWTLNNATVFPVTKNYSNQTEHGMMSAFARASYDYKGKYLFAGNLRLDGSSRFSKSNRWGLFPSVSAGWRFSDESFFKWAKPFLTDGKLRVSYGVTGNENLGNSGNYAYLPTYSTSGSYDGVGALAPNLIYNDLGWERTRQLNVGFDLSMYKGRYMLTLDYYDKNTDNLLYNVNVPHETGYTKMIMNVGALKNTGVELAFKATFLQTKNWSIYSAFNISHNVTRAVRLADHQPFSTGLKGIVYIQEGAKIGEFYGVRHDGIFQYDESNAFDDNWKQLTPVFAQDGAFSHYTLDGKIYDGEVHRKVVGNEVLKGGDVNWLDAPSDADGVIDFAEDRVKIGCSQPVVFGGFNTTVSWKNLSLFVAFNYSLGNDIYNCAAYNRNGYVTSKCAPSPEWIENMWTKPGDVALYPTPDYNRSVNKNALADFWIEDGSFVRLQSLKLSYSLPTQIAKLLKMRELVVSLYGNNLLTWTNYSGFDPEFGGSTLAEGIDNGKYPRRREFGFNINFGF